MKIRMLVAAAAILVLATGCGTTTGTGTRLAAHHGSGAMPNMKMDASGGMTMAGMPMKAGGTSGKPSAAAARRAAPRSAA